MTRESDSNSLAPGFRFHPTDQELVRYYLKRKVTNKPTRSDPIASVDIYKSEPWDLPSYSKLKTRDLEWYFFSVLDKKYGNGSKTNRATEKGYWKTTGNDRPVTYGSRKVGMKKTLVYHLGRAPRGERSNWVMHEYRLADEELEKAGVPQDAYVLCRVFQKSGTGPKNGEKYGAPFIEEEWEDDDVKIVSGEEQGAVVVAADVDLGDGVYNAQDPGQNVDVDIPPLSFYYGESSNYSEQPVEYSEKPSMDEPECGSEIPDDNLFFDVPEEYERDLGEIEVKNEFASKLNDPHDFSYLYDNNNNNYVEATDNNSNEGLYIETNDLPHFTEAEYNDFDVGEYLTFFDGETPEPVSDKLTNEDCAIPEQAPVTTEKPVKEEEISITSQHVPEAQGGIEPSLSKLEPEPAKFESDMKYPFMKHAFASEFPSKDAIRKLHSEGGQSSSSVHVNAGIIRIRNITLNTTGISWSYDKNGNLKIVLSFSLLENMAPTTSLVSSKTGDVPSRSLFFLMVMWVLILSVSFKTASYIYTR